MFIHSIVYVVLLILSTTAAVASSSLISKAPREQQAHEPETETTDTHQV